MSESFNKPPANPDDDTVYTMGASEQEGAGGPSYLQQGREPFDFSNFTGSLAQLAELFPGVQAKPQYAPGLTDLRFTRSFAGTGEDVNPLQFGGDSAGTRFWSPSAAPGPSPASSQNIVYQQPLPGQGSDANQGALNDFLLSNALNMDWSGAYQDYLDKLEAQNQDISISNVFTPTNVNYQTQSQQQKQWMGGSGQGQEQDQQDDSQDDTSLQDILDSITNNDTTDGGAFDDSFFTDVTTGGGNYVDTVKGGNFNDTINLDDIFEGTDTTGGGNYVDTIKGGNFNDTLVGGNQNDTLIGGNDNDTIIGGNQNDTLIGGNGTDTLISGNGTDTLVSGNGTDTLISGNGTDTIVAGNGIDSIISGNGIDSIIGGNGNDTLPGGISDATKLANDEIVKQAYENLFNRPADQEGLDYWSDQLDAGKSPTVLLRDLVSGAQGEDAKTAANTKTVNDLYKELLGRDVDEGGLDYYRAELAAGAKPEDIARNIISGAKAGSEASEISQAEYDRYFGRPAQPDPSTRPTPQNVDSLFPNVAPGDLAVYKDATSKLNDLARDFMANQDGGYDMASYDPEGFREAFVANVAQRDPELFSKISGLDLAEVDLGEGLLGTSAMPLITAVNAAFNSDSFADAAGNIDRAFATAGIADVAATALAMAGLPVVGQVAAAAIMLDSVLSKALGYDSPIQDGVDWMAQQTEKAAEWISNTFGDLWGGIEDFVGGIGDFFGGIGDWFAEGGAVRFQEGGLVDFPSESAYNYTDFYGPLAQPQLSLDQVQPEMAFAGGGLIPLLGGGKIAKGPGGGLDDLIPTSIDGRRAAALSDGEFVIPADVVSMMGDGSSDAGAKRFYDLVKQIRQHKTGTEKQAGPLPVGKILERTIS